MTAARPVVNLAGKFALFEDHWSPKIVGQLNDLHITIVKAKGEFVWHSHADTDEMFLVQQGELTIELRGREDVAIGPGELFVVPRGVEHRPVATSECHVVLLEPAGVTNTGDGPAGDRTATAEWI